MNALRLSLLAAVAAIILAACAPYEIRPLPRPTERTAAEAPLDRAERLLAERRIDDAEQAMAQIDSDRFSARDMHRLRLLRAGLALAGGQTLAALRDLPPPESTPDRDLAARTEALRADIFLTMGDPAGAVAALVHRGRLLTRSSERAENDARIWRVLMDSPLDGSMQSRFAGADRLTRGWLDLALIARGAVPGATDTLLRDWRLRYPDHPGTPRRAQEAITDRRGGGWAQLQRGGPVAVLLPEHGDLAALGDALRAAFMAAWEVQPEPRPRVRFYDSGAFPQDARRVVDQAAAEGAALVIGPLRRPHVIALAQSGPLPVPVLALNYLDEDVAPPFNLFQFGLAPEDEARAAVRRNNAEGRGGMLALITQADWSARVLRAVELQASAQGNRLLDSQSLIPGADLSDTVRRLLRVDASEERHRALTAVLGMQPEFQPRPRADAGALLLIARQTDAQQAVSFIAYHGATDVPVYLTALAWDGVLPVPRELRGARICDMPWMMRTADAPWLPLREQLRAEYPDAFEQLPRLFALGHDALLLAVRLQQGWQPGQAFPGSSGVLQLDEDGRVRRELDCATLTAEGANALPPLMYRPRDDAFGDDSGAWPRHPGGWR